jgi:hypothetical protein
MTMLSCRLTLRCRRCRQGSSLSADATVASPVYQLMPWRGEAASIAGVRFASGAVFIAEPTSSGSSVLLQQAWMRVLPVPALLLIQAALRLHLVEKTSRSVAVGARC